MTIFAVFTIYTLAIQLVHCLSIHPGELVAVIMGISTLSVVVSIIVLYLHHKEPGTRAPRWLRRSAFGGLAKALCMRESIPEYTDDKVAPAKPEGTMEPEDLEDPVKPPISLAAQVEPDELKVYLRYLTEKMRTKDEEDAILEEWRAVARIIDRVLFWICFIVVVIVVIVLMSREDSH